MKQTRKLFMLFLTSIFFISCTADDPFPNEDDACVGDNYLITLDTYIKKIENTPTDWRALKETSEFTYNEYNLLENQNSYTFDYNNNYAFNYQCNNKVGKMFGVTYSYNSENKITAVKSDRSNFNLIYSGQSVQVKGNIFIDVNKEITLELNTENLVSKVTRTNSYSTFEYDSNGNLTKAKDFDSSGALINQYEITYDQNPNPFYGQLTSVYLVNFIEYFYKSAQLGLNGLIIYGYDSFRFPYFKNNALTIEEVTNTAPYNLLLEREFTYNTQNYPIKIKFTYAGLHQSDYEIEYN
jgi:hypothetical protein